MRAAEVMTRDVVTVRPDAMVREAARMMDELNVGALPVCDGRQLVGMLTDRDIVVRSTADGMRPDATPVQALMTEEVCWCFEDDPVEKVERTMAERQIRRIPVVDRDRRLVGMIALGDLATDRAPGTEEALRRISEPSEPDRAPRAQRQGESDAPWPAYGEGTDGGDGPHGEGRGRPPRG